MRAIKGNPLALVVEIARGIDNQRLVDVASDLERWRICYACCCYRNIVGAGLDQRGKIGIEDPCLLFV